MVQLSNASFWRPGCPSLPFNARDILAPAAAHLANGVALSNMGDQIEQLHPMHWALPISDQQGIQGWVVHIDRFGNCVTNIHRDVLEPIQGERSYKCYVGNTVLKGSGHTNYDADSGDPVLIYNSDDILEIAINRGSASTLLDIPKGAPVNIVFGDEKILSYQNSASDGEETNKQE
jgi:S-adenosylmethionine hydrolase